MPERSFGRTIKSRRSGMGLSQAKLGDLVGRSAATIRAWERDKSRPSDPKVVSALAAILAIDETLLFDRAGLAMPAVDDLTIEQALATLAPEEDNTDPDGQAGDDGSATDETPAPHAPAPSVTGSFVVTQAAAVSSEPSYLEETGQRQLYRVRMLATLVGVVALIVALIWAIGQGWDAFTGWWDSFFGNLRL